MNLDFSSLSDDFLKNLLNRVNTEIYRRHLKKSPICEFTLAQSIAHSDLDLLDIESFKVNSENLLSLPINPKTSYAENKKYIKCILNQNWMHLFDDFENESDKFYVYAHVDPRHKGFECKELNLVKGFGVPFYIGKGTGNRACDMKRNQGHGKMIATLRKAMHSDESMVIKIFDLISERKAMEIESKLIYFFGTIYEQNRRGMLLNLDVSRKPKFLAPMHMYISKKVKRIIETRAAV